MVFDRFLIAELENQRQDANWTESRSFMHLSLDNQLAIHCNIVYRYVLCYENCV